MKRQRLGIGSKSASSAPAVEGGIAAKIWPLRQICFSQNHGASRAQTTHDYRIRRHNAAYERKRPRCRLHLVSSREVVLHQDRNAMQWSSQMPGLALGIQFFRDLQR